MDQGLLLLPCRGKHRFLEPYSFKRAVSDVADETSGGWQCAQDAQMDASGRGLRVWRARLGGIAPRAMEFNGTNDDGFF